MIARWKPVHLGHAAVLDALCDAAEHVVVGIGSANRYDLRNPFTAAETEAMLRIALEGRDHVEIVRVRDLGDGPRWAERVVRDLAPLDLYVTANDWVRDLLAPTWSVLHPVHLVPPPRRVPVSGTLVRTEMARGAGWRALVPPAIAAFLDENGLVERFRAEFGRATLGGDVP